ncbi:MAG TPA: glycosyltransferase family 2 protein [Candidatus Acidoferrum sp.]|nr:glycosyltransferase family 2 protein [Candidatus Acidoferrum sp.]
MSGRAPIAAIVLTYNEEPNIGVCLESLAEWVGDLFVVDSRSTDATQSIAARYEAQVVEHTFESHSRQWSWALEHLPIRHEWVLGLDADQRVTPELKAEILDLFGGGGARLDGIEGLYVNRRQIFRGRWIRHGGYYPKYLLKLFRAGRVRIDERDLIDHHFYVTGSTRTLKHDLIEDNAREADIAFWLGKHIRYAALQARVEALRDGWGPVTPALRGNPDQRTARLKQAWEKLPLYVRPALYFSYRYFVRLGFLDGKQGFVFHFLQAFWYRVLVDIYLDELRRGRASVPAREALGARQP